MDASDWLTALLSLGSAGIGYVAATVTTSRQLAAQARLTEKGQKRETLQRFNANVLRWSDTVQHYVAAKGRSYEASERDRYNEAWRELTDSYSLVLLTSSDALMRRIAEVFVPARDRVLASLSEQGPEGVGEARAAAGALRNAAGELLNDLREEMGEPRLTVLQDAADETRKANLNSEE